MKVLLYNFYCILFIVLLATPFSYAQLPNVLVDASAGNAECTLVINPKNPDYLIGATNTGAIYRSTDAGQTWTVGNISDFSSAQMGWDIVLAADTAGHFFCQAMDLNSAFRTLRSDDYGVNWGTETVLGNPGCIEDKSWLTIDRSPISPYNGRIYCAWTLRHGGGCDTAGYLFIQHSVDAGASWSLRDTLDHDPSFVPPIGGGLAVGPSGEIGVSWCGDLPDQIHFKKSSDGGVTWPTSAVIVDDNVEPNDDYAAFIDASIGATGPLTSLAYDISGGPYNGNLYCVWDDLRNGENNADIFLARSTDGGQTWETQRINDDTTVRNQILGNVAVDPSSGWVYVSYTDARLNKDNFDDTLHRYLAWSNDGAQTFQNIQVSQEASTVDYLHSDYMGLDAYDGKVCLLWVGATSSNTQHAWTACITQSQLVTGELALENIHGLQFYPALPNPSIDFTSFDFRLTRKSAVTLKVIDESGRVVATLLNGKDYAPGSHEVRLDHRTFNLTPGIYLAVLSDSYKAVSRKFEVVQ